MCHQRKNTKLFWIILIITSSLAISFGCLIIKEKTKPLKEMTIGKSNADIYGNGYKNLILKDIKKYDNNFIQLELYEKKNGTYYRLGIHESYSDKITKGEMYDIKYVYQEHSFFRPEFEIYSIKKSY